MQFKPQRRILQYQPSILGNWSTNHIVGTEYCSILLTQRDTDHKHQNWHVQLCKNKYLCDHRVIVLLKSTLTKTWLKYQNFDANSTTIVQWIWMTLSRIVRDQSCIRRVSVVHLLCSQGIPRNFSIYLVRCTSGGIHAIVYDVFQKSRTKVVWKSCNGPSVKSKQNDTPPTTWPSPPMQDC